MKRATLITSSANPAIKWLRGLALKKNREEEGLFIIEGARDVDAAVSAGWQIHTLVSVEGHESPVAAPNHIVVPHELMSRIVNRDNAQAVIAVMHQRWGKVDDMARGLWLALEDIRDPGNLGTIIRTADAVSCSGIVLIGQTCDAFAPEVVRATMGSLARLPLAALSREEFISWRSTYKGHLIGTHLLGAVDYRVADYAMDNTMIVMGSESAGLSDVIAETCDQRVKIPMSGQTESLNLSIASAVMLYEARRKKL